MRYMDGSIVFLEGFFLGSFRPCPGSFSTLTRDAGPCIYRRPSDSALVLQSRSSTRKVSSQHITSFFPVLPSLRGTKRQIKIGEDTSSDFEPVQMRRVSSFSVWSQQHRHSQPRTSCWPVSSRVQQRAHHPRQRHVPSSTSSSSSSSGQGSILRFLQLASHVRRDASDVTWQTCLLFHRP